MISRRSSVVLPKTSRHSSKHRVINSEMASICRLRGHDATGNGSVGCVQCTTIVNKVLSFVPVSS